MNDLKKIANGLEEIVNFLQDQEKDISGKLYKLPIDSALIEARQKQSVTRLVELTQYLEFHNKESSTPISGERNLKFKERILHLNQEINSWSDKTSPSGESSETEPCQGSHNHWMSDPDMLIKALRNLTELPTKHEFIRQEGFALFQQLLWTILFYNRFIIPYCGFILPYVDARIALRATDLAFMCSFAEKSIEHIGAIKDRLTKSTESMNKEKVNIKQIVLHIYHSHKEITPDMRIHTVARKIHELLKEKGLKRSITSIKRYLKEENLYK